jgi:hypothetical protein
MEKNQALVVSVGNRPARGQEKDEDWDDHRDEEWENVQLRTSNVQR